MILSEEQIMKRLAIKADELGIDVEGSSVRYLQNIMALAEMCDFATEKTADLYFTGALQKGLASGAIKRERNVGTA